MKKAKDPKKFDMTKTYVRTSGWRGYEQPVYAICGANDTGMFEDSPCPSNVCNRELEGVKKMLGAIPVMKVTCQSSNVFCVHRYLVVPPAYVEDAKKIVREFLKLNKTTLLYEA